MAGADFCGKALAALSLSLWKIKIYMTHCGKALAALSLSLWKNQNLHDTFEVPWPNSPLMGTQLCVPFFFLA